MAINTIVRTGRGVVTFPTVPMLHIVWNYFRGLIRVGASFKGRAIFARSGIILGALALILLPWPAAAQTIFICDGSYLSGHKANWGNYSPIFNLESGFLYQANAVTGTSLADALPCSAGARGKTIAAATVGTDTYVYVASIYQFSILKYLGAGQYQLLAALGAGTLLGVNNSMSPVAVLISPDARTAYIGMGFGQGFTHISELDITNPAAPVRKHVLPISGNSMALSPDNSRIVALTSTGIYDIKLPLNLNSFSFHTIPTTTGFLQFPIQVAPDGQYAYLGDPDKAGIIRVPLPFGTLTYVDLGFPSYYRVKDIVFHPSGNYAYAHFWPSGSNVTNHMVIVNTSTNAVSRSPWFESCIQLGTLAINPVGDYLISACVSHRYWYQPFQVSSGGSTLTPLAELPVSTANYQVGISHTLSIPFQAKPPDSTPPIITASVSPGPNAAGWNNSNPTISWSVNDPESGIGSSPGCLTTAVSVETAGTTFTCTATNNAGLLASTSVTIKLDKTVPGASAARTPLPNANGWNSTNVTVLFSCTDALAGPLAAAYSTTISNEGASQLVSYVCQDAAGNSSTASAGVSIDKTKPIVTSVVATPNPAAVNTAISLSANLTDSGSSNLALFQYRIDAGPVNSSDPVSGASATATGTLGSFPAPAVINLCTLAIDTAGNQSTEECIMVAVYDPSSGFVTGAGTFQSPSGALTGSTASGRAQFAFQSKYLRGATVPSGNTQFKFKAANFEFDSIEYQWLVVAGARAQFKGKGVIKGQTGTFDFILTAIDGALPGGGGQDKFRLKITGPEQPTCESRCCRRQSRSSDPLNPTHLSGCRRSRRPAQ